MNLTNSNAPATKKQLFALFCGTGLNTTNCVMTVRQASNLIDNMKNGFDIESDLRSFGAIGKTKEAKVDFQTIYNMADKAGKEAAEKCIPTPMVVTEHSNPLDDNSNVVKQHFVPDGICGFSSIKFAGNTSWAKWVIKNNLAKKSYNKGYYIPVFDYNQSMELKSAYSNAFVKVLNQNGIKAYSESRID